MITEGEVAAGDPIVVVDRAGDSVPLSEVTRLHAHDKDDLEGLRRIVGIAALPETAIEVTFARSGVTALWNRCESPLLELAEEHSIMIDAGCRAGSCGTRVTRLLAGSVRYLHQPNAPLQGDEFLPCIAVQIEPLSLDA